MRQIIAEPEYSCGEKCCDGRWTDETLAEMTSYWNSLPITDIEGLEETAGEVK